MIPEMTNISLFHYTCRGIHAPRDKYIFDRSVVEGFMQIVINENLQPTFSFTAYAGEVEPTESNLESVLRSLRFYSRDSRPHMLAGVSMLSCLDAKKIEELTLEEVTHCLTRSYQDFLERKGSLHFQSQYGKTLVNNPQMVLTYIQNGGSLYV